MHFSCNMCNPQWLFLHIDWSAKIWSIIWMSLFFSRLVMPSGRQLGLVPATRVTRRTLRWRIILLHLISGALNLLCTQVKAVSDVAGARGVFIDWKFRSKFHIWSSRAGDACHSKREQDNRSLILKGKELIRLEPAKQNWSDPHTGRGRKKWDFYVNTLSKDCF